MNIAPFIFLIVIMALIALKALYWVYLWQLKEYRIDRMRDFASTGTGKIRLWNNPFTWIDIMLCVAVGTIFFFGMMPERVLASHALALAVTIGALELIIVISFCIEILLYIQIRKQFRPKVTLRALLIWLLTVCSTLMLISIAWRASSAYQAIIFLGTILVSITPFLVLFWVFFFAPFLLLAKNSILFLARQKLRSLTQRPIVIGITGSYGKTTTKEFLSTILSQKYTVFSTPKHVNVDIGVARAILQSLRSDTQVCVIEMGAYRTGEIQKICNLVRPDIAIITAISDQHLGLFGDVEHIIQAKSELIQSIPEHGLVVVNIDSERAVEAAKRYARSTVRTYSAFTQPRADVYVSDVSVAPDNVQAVYHGVSNTFDIKAVVHGKHVFTNVIAAIAVAEYLKVDPSDIQNALTTVSTLEGTMRVIRAKTGTIIIDDHYNSNPDGCVAALEYMNIYSAQRKIIIFPGMLELGAHSSERHQEVGRAIASCVDRCILTKEDSAIDIRAGAESIPLGQRKAVIDVITSPEQVVEILKAMDENDCVLIEGRVHSLISGYIEKA